MRQKKISHPANLTSASFVAINKIISYNNGVPKLRNIDYSLTIFFRNFDS
jgi:hypothetical protein